MLTDQSLMHVESLVNEDTVHRTTDLSSHKKAPFDDHFLAVS